MINIRDLEDKISLEMDVLLTEKIHIINDKGNITYEDVIELHIITIMKSHISETLHSIKEEVPIEIIVPWGMVKLHEILLTFHNSQAVIETDEYINILNKVSNRLFLKIFSSHL